MGAEDGSWTVCPRYHRAVELIGRRWTGAILRALQSGRMRFTDIAGMVPGLSDRLLSERLKELEAEGLITRTVYPEMPVRIEYRLTEKGRALGEVMDAIATWAEQWLPPSNGGAPARLPEADGNQPLESEATVGTSGRSPC
jgi:DNA-binding HxlR family transcriptional regulator